MSDHYVTTATAHHARVGDRVRFAGEPNSVRRRVSKVHSETSTELVTHHRPSRGFARHVRRRKQMERRQ